MKISFYILLFSTIAFSEWELPVTSLKKGDLIAWSGGKPLEIVGWVERNGNYYGVAKEKNNEKTPYYIRAVKREDTKTAAQIREEIENNKPLDALQVNNIPISYIGSNYYLKKLPSTFVFGGNWMENWKKEGSNKQDPGYQSLIQFFSSLSLKSAVVRFVAPNNMVWDGKKWSFVLTGESKLKEDELVVLDYYRYNLEKNWGIKAGEDLLNSFVQSCEACKELIAKPSEKKNAKNKPNIIPQTHSKDEKMKSEQADIKKIDTKKEETKRFDHWAIFPGKKITTPKGTKLFVKKYITSGRRGEVYEVEDEKGKVYALKMAKNELKETLDSIQEEPKKIEAIAKLGLKHSRVIESGDNYLLKEWVSGTRGDDWFSGWVTKKKKSKDPAFLALLELFKKVSDQGAYIGDLNPKNLFWDGKEWTIIESGSTRLDLKSPEAYQRFLEKFYDRWTKHTPCFALVKILGLNK